MAQAKLQLCPTRIDGSPVLVAHKVDRKRCQERQRQRYHKCFTCAWNNDRVALHGEPQPVVETSAPAATKKTNPIAAAG